MLLSHVPEWGSVEGDWRRVNQTHELVVNVRSYIDTTRLWVNHQLTGAIFIKLVFRCYVHFHVNSQSTRDHTRSSFITPSLSLYHLSPLDKDSNNHNLYIYVFNNKYISAYEIVHWMLSATVCLVCLSEVVTRGGFIWCLAALKAQNVV